MLSYLKIENLAIIDALSVEFGPGLNVLTGETGAGKSIIVDAVGLLLGERGGADMIRTGCERLTVEGLFETAGRAALLDNLGRMGIDSGPEGIVLRREITSAGRSRAFINGTLATLQQVKEIGEALADLHGQHQHQSLLRPEGQMEALDRFEGHGEEAGGVAEAAGALRGLITERTALRRMESGRAVREEVLRTEIGDIAAVSPDPEEEVALRREEALLRHAEEVRSLAEEVCALLNEDDASVLSRLGTVRDRLGRLAAIDDRCAESLRAVEEARLSLREALRGIEPYRDGGDHEPGRLEAVAARLAALDRLKRRYGPGLSDVVARLAAAREELSALGGAAERLGAIDPDVAGAARRYSEKAAHLSRRRREAARSLQTAIRRELKALAMESCRFSVEFRMRDDPDSEVVVEGRRVAWGEGGVESVEFLIAPNPGEEPRPLARIASGGELSRIMLALRAASESPTDARSLIFDEVDAGVGGPVAEAVALRLKALARAQQVLCITHLPQIAALADCHLRVEKETQGGRTRVAALPLQGSDRVEELARMIGSPQAPTARRHAAALINGRKAP